jgi:hypothetical protein
VNDPALARGPIAAAARPRKWPLGGAADIPTKLRFTQVVKPHKLDYVFSRKGRKDRKEHAE